MPLVSKSLLLGVTLLCGLEFTTSCKHPSATYTAEPKLGFVRMVSELIMLRGQYEVCVVSDGRVSVNDFGKSTHFQISSNRVNELMEDLQKRGLLEMRRQDFVNEFATLAAEKGGWGRVDGSRVTLTMGYNGKTNTVEWDDPDEYLVVYPEARRVAAFYDCAKLVTAFIKQ